jgi:hypothetical protein
MVVFDRILVLPGEAAHALWHAIALFRYLGPQSILFHILSLSDRQFRPQCLPALCSQARLALPYLTSGKPAQARKRLTAGASKRIILIDICFIAVSQAGFLSGMLAAHRRRYIGARLQLYLHRTGVDTQPYPNPTGLNGKAANPFWS